MQNLIDQLMLGSDESADEAKAMLMAMCEEGIESVVLGLTDAFEQSRGKARARLLLLFGATQRPEFAPFVEDTMRHDEDRKIRAYAATAAIGYPELIGTLAWVRAMDKSKRVRAVAQIAIELLEEGGFNYDEH